MSLLDALNEPQRQAVMATDGPLLILAGAGSGKTRVLTHRTAYLIEECGVNPYNIMAITFTNKAAGEMRERIDQMVGYGSESIWVCTFHSTCVRILRRYIDRLGFGTNFTIYDSDDQKTLMKDICKRLEIDTKMYKEKMFLSAISSAKDELIDPIEFETRAAGDYVKRKQAQVYREYQQALKQNNALDFDDLIMKTVELFKLDKEVLASYQDRFRYIMVDEYQDTNTAQFELIRLLALKYQNLCVVGDDDQSIYKFRGANIYNILNFEHHFPDATVIKLEQNYRSTQNILDAANAVIANNQGRKEKRLWTDNGAGGRTRNFQTNTRTPPEIMPQSAPHLLARFQNSAKSTTGPKAAPKPAQAKETILKTELSGSRAKIIAIAAMTSSVERAISMDCFSVIFTLNTPHIRSLETLEDAASSWESAVDMVAARIPASVTPAASASSSSAA